MARFLLDFDFWCKEVTKKIKYRPDRQDLYSELHQHLQDHYQEFLEQDMEHEEAMQKALQAMVLESFANLTYDTSLYMRV